ncbi:hypothetical protein LXL04_011673 [Taraxacum kok-saghyz]
MKIGYGNDDRSGVDGSRERLGRCREGSMMSEVFGSRSGCDRDVLGNSRWCPGKLSQAFRQTLGVRRSRKVDFKGGLFKVNIHPPLPNSIINVPICLATYL